jgi:hypothetical protein
VAIRRAIPSNNASKARAASGGASISRLPSARWGSGSVAVTLWWVVLMVFLISPVGYGWGYRGWGAPCRAASSAAERLRAGGPGSGAPFDHHAWGRGGDLVWAILALEMFWLAWALWAR